MQYMCVYLGTIEANIVSDLNVDVALSHAACLPTLSLEQVFLTIEWPFLELIIINRG